MKKSQKGIKPLRRRNGAKAKDLFEHSWIYMACEDGCGQSVRVPGDVESVKCSVCSMKKTEFPVHPDYADDKKDSKPRKPGRPRKKRGMASDNKNKTIKKSGKKRGRPRKSKTPGVK